MRKNLRNRRGFTLMELLIAVLVIGIIAALVFPKFGPVKERSYVAAMKNSINKALAAEENYMDENNSYGAETCVAAADGSVTCSGALSTATGFVSDDHVGLTITPNLDLQYGITVATTHLKTNATCSVDYGAEGPGGPEHSGKIVCTD